MTATARLYRRGEWQGDEDGSESVVDVWEIVTDDEETSISDVLAASGLPAKGDSHEEKTAAILVTHDVNQDKDVLTLWYYTARYSTKQKTREDAPQDEQRTKGGMKSASKQVPAFFDSRGYPLVNTAGDLYEGLTRKRRLRVIPCTHNFTEIPNWFFDLADTINSAAVTIHGKEYPPLTCMLTDIDMPNEPSRDKAGTLYWPVTYSIAIDPDGYYIILPNKGSHEYVFQKRTSASPPDDKFSDCTKAEYDAVGTANLKQKIKRRIQTSEQQDLAQDIWLDHNGQAIRVISLSATQLGTGSISADSTTLTLASGSFDASIHTGALIRIIGAGPLVRPLTTQIVSVTSSTIAVLASPARTTATTVPVWMSGAICNYFVMEDIADWTGIVPLPNNHPGA